VASPGCRMKPRRSLLVNRQIGTSVSRRAGLHDAGCRPTRTRPPPPDSPTSAMTGIASVSCADAQGSARPQGVLVNRRGRLRWWQNRRGPLRRGQDRRTP
jgi:hypothetical protein